MVDTPKIDRSKYDSIDTGGQAMLDKAPQKGGKSPYLRLPPRIGLFDPKEDRIYRLIFLPWKAGACNKTASKGNWTSNLFFAIHTQVGPEDSKLVCSQNLRGKPCPGCEHFQVMKPKGEGKDYWDKVLKPLKAKNRELFWVHDLDGEPKNLFVWDESTFLFGDFLREKFGMDKSRVLFAHPTKGYVVAIKGKKKQIGANSCVDFSNIEFMKRTDVSELKNGELPQWMFQCMEKYGIDDFLIETPYKDAKMLYGTAESINEEEEELEPEETAIETESAEIETEPEEIEQEVEVETESAKEEEEESMDEEPEVETEEEPEEEVKPKPAGKKPKKPAKEEEEEEELIEEESETPPRRTRKK